MDVKMPYHEAKEIVDNEGMAAFFNHLEGKYPDLELYSISEAWLHNREYICKCHGSKGDLIIQWT